MMLEVVGSSAPENALVRSISLSGEITIGTKI
jgi:hypothetical protein